jgi:hypothetical protein
LLSPQARAFFLTAIGWNRADSAFLENLEIRGHVAGCSNTIPDDVARSMTVTPAREGCRVQERCDLYPGNISGVFRQPTTESTLKCRRYADAQRQDH